MPRAVDGYKKCSKCTLTKPISEFNRRNRSPDELDYQCKACTKIYADSVRDRLRELDKESYRRNIIKRRAKSTKYNCIQSGRPVPIYVLDILSEKRIPRNHEDAVRHERDRHREYKRTVYREIHNQKNKLYSQTERGKQVCNLKSLRYRARKSNTISNFSDEDFKFLLKFQKGKCGCCNKKFSKELVPEMDHIIPVSYGGDFILDNVQLLCRSCNASKSNKTIRFIPLITSPQFEEGKIRQK